MARGRSSSGRDASRRRYSRAPDPYDPIFDDNYLLNLNERFDATYVDLTRYQDRRRWHPDKIKNPYYPQGLVRRPRILIVPEGHRLARRQTYGGKFSVNQVLSKQYRIRREGWRHMSPSDWPYGNVKGYTTDDVSKRVGFSAPWQVIVCVRRKRRRQTLFALNIAGRVGLGRGKRQNRTPLSEVRC